MKDNLHLKRGLITQSLSPVFALLIIRHGSIPIDSVKEIEAMIDLLAERFTVSPVSGQEYDTEVKKKADDVTL